MSNADEIAKIQAAIDTIEEQLNLGITSTTNDGISATIDPDALRTRKTELERKLEKLQAEDDDRPDSSSHYRPVRLP